MSALVCSKCGKPRVGAVKPRAKAMCRDCVRTKWGQHEKAATLERRVDREARQATSSWWTKEPDRFYEKAKPEQRRMAGVAEVKEPE